jgi:tetratricopeptide (TPR) repeat protein
MTPELNTEKPRLGRAPKIVLALFAFALLLFTKSEPMSWADASRMGTIQSLVEHGTLALDQSDYVWQGDKVQLGGHFYSHQPPMMALAGSVPYGILHMFGRGIADPGTYRILTLCLVGLPVLLGLISLGRLMRRTGANDTQTAWLLAAASFGTLLMPYSLVLNQHGLAAALVLLALSAIVDRRLATAGILLSLATTVDLTAVFFAIAMVLPIAFPHLLSGSKSCADNQGGIGAVLRYGLSALPVLAIHFGINYSIAGDLIPLGLHTEGFEYSMSPFLLMNLTGGGEAGPDGSFLAYAKGALVGESGLFSHSPTLVWAWVLGVMGILALLSKNGADSASNHGKQVALVAAIDLAALAIIAYYLTQSRNFGGSSFGMRWFTVFAPAMFLLPALWFGLAEKAQARKALLLLAPLLVWSCSASALGSVQPWSKFHYNYTDSPEGALDTNTEAYPSTTEHLQNEWDRITNFRKVFTPKSYDDLFQKLLDQHRRLYLTEWDGMTEEGRTLWIKQGLAKLQHVADLFDRENSKVQSRTVSHFWLAKFHTKLGDRQQAQREYEIALALDPGFRLAASALQALNAAPR